MATLYSWSCKRLTTCNLSFLFLISFVWMLRNTGEKSSKNSQMFEFLNAQHCYYNVVCLA